MDRACMACRPSREVHGAPRVAGWAATYAWAAVKGSIPSRTRVITVGP
jgi:hypothetical protein